MITEEKLAEFKKGQDYIPLPSWTIGEICDTLSALWRVARAAEEIRARGNMTLELDEALAALREGKETL